MVSPTSEWTLRKELISLSCYSKSPNKNCLCYLSYGCLPWVRASKTKCGDERWFSDSFRCVILLSISYRHHVIFFIWILSLNSNTFYIFYTPKSGPAFRPEGVSGVWQGGGKRYPWYSTRVCRWGIEMVQSVHLLAEVRSWCGFLWCVILKEPSLRPKVINSLHQHLLHCTVWFSLMHKQEDESAYKMSVSYLDH